MEIIRTVQGMQEYSENRRTGKQRIGLAPTMGYLHRGHLSLVRMAKEQAEVVVMSIFVNPTQFGPDEDLTSYPRSFEKDCQAAESAGVDAIFAPEADEIYRKGFQTYVSLKDLPAHLCGLSRPIHFRGVATVVAKLFNCVRPHVAVFGQKDYQQLLVIRRMALDLNFDIEIIGAPILREPDGLAMSSRNVYLTESQRKSARALNQALERARALVHSGITDAEQVIREAAEFIQSHPETEIDYIAITDPETLDDMTTIDRTALMALAVRVGKARLIDNRMIGE